METLLFIFISATLILSIMLGLFCTLSVSPSKKNQVQGFDLFTDVVIGSFIGGIAGGIIGFIILYILIVLVIEGDGMLLGFAILGDSSPLFISAITFLFFWVGGIAAGAGKSIRNSLN